MGDIFSENQSKGFKRWIIDHQVGLLGTIVFHLLVLVFVIALKLNPVKNVKDRIFLEFQEPSTAKVDPAKIVQELLKKTDSKAITQSQDNKATTVRNVAVNSNLDKLTDKLVDDKFGKSNPVYEEARQLAARMKDNQQLYKKSLEAEKTPSNQQGQGGGVRSNSEKAYKGASVLSYSVQGRQGTYLPVPAYLCEGGGDVVVNIVVNQRGVVLDAAISARTTASECLFAEALKAAKRSRFTMDEKAPAAQKGSITYRFVAQ
jgi:Gram-negative bacterial tonB protein.